MQKKDGRFAPVFLTVVTVLSLQHRFPGTIRTMVDGEYVILVL